MRLENAIAHQEIGSDLSRPRHPVVCLLDFTGFIGTIALLAVYPQKFVVASLPMAIAALYAVSSMYHWLPANEFRQKLDHLMIAVVIGAAYVPFWGGDLLPGPVATLRLVILGGIFVATCVAKLFFFSWQKVGGGVVSRSWIVWDSALVQ